MKLADKGTCLIHCIEHCWLWQKCNVDLYVFSGFGEKTAWKGIDQSNNMQAIVMESDADRSAELPDQTGRVEYFAPEGRQAPFHPGMYQQRRNMFPKQNMRQMYGKPMLQNNQYIPQQMMRYPPKQMYPPQQMFPPQQMYPPKMMQKQTGYPQMMKKQMGYGQMAQMKHGYPQMSQMKPGYGQMTQQQGYGQRAQTRNPYGQMQMSFAANNPHMQQQQGYAMPMSTGYHQPVAQSGYQTPVKKKKRKGKTRKYRNDDDDDEKFFEILRRIFLGGRKKKSKRRRPRKGYRKKRSKRMQSYHEDEDDGDEYEEEGFEEEDHEHGYPPHEEEEEEEEEYEEDHYHHEPAPRKKMTGYPPMKQRSKAHASGYPAVHRPPSKVGYPKKKKKRSVRKKRYKPKKKKSKRRRKKTGYGKQMNQMSTYSSQPRGNTYQPQQGYPVQTMTNQYQSWNG